MINLNKMDSSWRPLLPYLHKEPFSTFKNKTLLEKSFQPRLENVLDVFEMPVKDIKVVILGVEPSIIPNLSFGKSFAHYENKESSIFLDAFKEELVNMLSRSVDEESNFVSLTERMKPFQQSLIMENPEWQTLEHWSKQGIFLLNQALTVETGQMGSHLKHWKEFTQRVVSLISKLKPCIWILLGERSKQYLPLIEKSFIVEGYDRDLIKEIPINPDWNYVIPAPFPIVMEGGKFLGSDCFHYTDEILFQKKEAKIVW